MYAIELRPSVDGVWRTYARWFVLVSIAFFSIYPLCNWLAARQTATVNLYFSYELNIPFIPEFIWIYLSLYVLFLIPPFLLDPVSIRKLGRQLVAATIFCGVIFLLLPSRLGFDRVIPDDDFYGSVFENLFAIDLPHNMAPSLHIVFSSLILLAIRDALRHSMVKLVVAGWLVLICLSTIFVHQHHLLDIATGLFVAFMFRYLLGKGEWHV